MAAAFAQVPLFRSTVKLSVVLLQFAPSNVLMVKFMLPTPPMLPVPPRSRGTRQGRTARRRP